MLYMCKKMKEQFFVKYLRTIYLNDIFLSNQHCTRSTDVKVHRIVNRVRNLLSKRCALNLDDTDSISFNIAQIFVYVLCAFVLI